MSNMDHRDFVRCAIVLMIAATVGVRSAKA
jgi:hypothetical protein